MLGGAYSVDKYYRLMRGFNDLTGKTIIPFATSGGSGMGKTNEALKPSCTGATLLEGKVWKSTAKKEELSVWADSLACR